MPEVGGGRAIEVKGGQVVTFTASIASGQSLAGAVDLGTGRLAKINMPGAWTAADLTFQTSDDGVTYRNLYDRDGAEYVVKAAADRSIIINLADWLGSRYVIVRSGTSAAAVNQGAARDLLLVTVP